MDIIEAVNIVLLEKEVKTEELKAFPNNQHLKNLIDALDIICDLAVIAAMSGSVLRKFKEKNNAK